MLRERGIYTLIDLHQDAWGPSLVAPPDEACPSGTGGQPVVGMAPQSGRPSRLTAKTTPSKGLGPSIARSSRR